MAIRNSNVNFVHSVMFSGNKAFNAMLIRAKHNSRLTFSAIVIYVILSGLVSDSVVFQDIFDEQQLLLDVLRRILLAPAHIIRV